MSKIALFSLLIISAFFAPNPTFSKAASQIGENIETYTIKGETKGRERSDSLQKKTTIFEYFPLIPMECPAESPSRDSYFHYGIAVEQENQQIALFDVLWGSSADGPLPYGKQNYPSRADAHLKNLEDVKSVKGKYTLKDVSFPDDDVLSACPKVLFICQAISTQQYQPIQRRQLSAPPNGIYPHINQCRYDFSFNESELASMFGNVPTDSDGYRDMVLKCQLCASKADGIDRWDQKFKILFKSGAPSRHDWFSQLIDNLAGVGFTGAMPASWTPFQN